MDGLLGSDPSRVWGIMQECAILEFQATSTMHRMCMGMGYIPNASMAEPVPLPAGWIHRDELCAILTLHSHPSGMTAAGRCSNSFTGQSMKIYANGEQAKH